MYKNKFVIDGVNNDNITNILNINLSIKKV